MKDGIDHIDQTAAFRICVRYKGAIQEVEIRTAGLKICIKKLVKRSSVIMSESEEERSAAVLLRKK